MRTSIRQSSRLVLLSAAVVAAGCMHNPRPIAPTTQVAFAASRPGDNADAFDAPDGPTGPAPTVNVFGELNDKPRTNGGTVGDEGFQQHTFADEGADSDISVDPAGKWMVFASTRHNVHAGIYVQKVDGSAVTRLTSDDSENAFPTFSPDGKTIAFCSTRSGSWNIYTMDTDGRNVVTVTTGNSQTVHPSFSPDGTRLVFSALGARSNQWELWTVNLTTGEKREIGYGLFPSWAPDKSVDRIAFQRARQRGSRWFSLWTLDLVDGEPYRVTEIAVSSNAAIVSPAWSPDGKRLTFATLLDPAHRTTNTTGKAARGEQDVWTIASDGTDRRRLTDGNGVNLSPFWSSDGRVYFVSNRSGTESVWSVRSDEGKPAIAAKPAEKSRQAIGSVDTGDADK
jgi:TolB protein